MNRGLRKRRLVGDINITPFTDVILVLLVIFMITTPIISQSSIKVKLPQASSTKAIENRNQAYITITSEGLTYLGNELVTIKELKNKIYYLHADNPNLSVVLRADKLARFKDVVNTLDILTELGVKNLDIAASNE
jgi:TonB system transport protein ExbD (group 2)